MSQKSIILIVSLFVIIVAGMFIYANMKKTELQPTEVVVPNEQTNPEPVLYPEITRIDAKHYYIDGVHTLVGELNMPTPCDLLNTEVTIMESFPEQVMVDFSVINNADVCAQVVTAQRFKVEFSAAEEASISARFMGRDIELNLIPAAEGESPEDFEVFIKG